MVIHKVDNYLSVCFTVIAMLKRTKIKIIVMTLIGMIVSSKRCCFNSQSDCIKPAENSARLKLSANGKWA